jgi:hypothetical protein
MPIFSQTNNNQKVKRGIANYFLSSFATPPFCLVNICLSWMDLTINQEYSIG